jgi:adenylylsulfate kinase
LTPDIYPVDHQLISRAAREIRLGQRAGVFWFTGLSGSGKSTLALALEKALFAEGFQVVVLDGDTIRSGINNNLGFSPEDRMENIRRIAEVAKLFVQNGIICLVSFISPTRAMRDMAREIVGPADFHDIFVDTPLDVCEARDVKGLYKRARAGEIPDFTGVSAPYEPPADPFLHLRTAGNTIDASLAELLAAVRPVVQIR